MTDDGKVSKDSVNYRQAETLFRACMTCHMFRFRDRCVHVAGTIKFRDVCNDWEVVKTT